MSRKRILIESLYLHPSNIGGPSKTIFDIARSLSQKYDVTCLSTDGGITDVQLIDKWHSQENFRCRYITSHSKLHVRFLMQAIPVIRKNDVIYLNSLFFVPSLIMSLFAIALKRKIIWSPRGETFAIGNNIAKRFYIYLIHRIRKNIHFHATTEQEEISIKETIGKDIYSFVIPNYLDLPTPVNSNRTGKDYILFLGRIAPIKQLERLIDALTVSNIFLRSDVEMYIAGPVEDKYRSYYNSLLKKIGDSPISNRIKFVGNIRSPQKEEYYRNALALVLPSKSENFGNVVLEALSQGTPVIATHGTPWSELNDYHAGFWVDDSVNSIASALDELLAFNQSDRELFSRNALELSKLYSPERTLPAWEKQL